MDAQFEPAVALATSHGALSSPIPDPVLAEIGRLLDDVRAALESDFRIATKAAARLAALLASRFPEGAPSRPARGGLAPWQQRKIQRVIEEGLEEGLSLEALARHADLSPSYFCRAFKQSFGEPPHAYIIKMRVERARTLMLNTTESLSQIALACGLVDQAHLCRCFRQVTGMTPGAWRRRHADDPRSVVVAG